MAYKLKPVECKNCKYYIYNIRYKSEGVCSKDSSYTRGHRICNKLPTNEDRRNAKINLYK